VRGRAKRLLYWFRTPPDIRVGRAPIDETAIRLLEEHNPGVEFDWTRILKAPPPAEAPRRDRDSRDRDQRGRREARPARGRGSDGGPRPSSAPPVSQAQAQSRPQPSAVNTAPPSPVVPAAAEPGLLSEADVRALELSANQGGAAPVELVDAREQDARVDSSAPEVSAQADPGEPDPEAGPRPEDIGSASYQRLGAEGLVRLRARYAEVMARIAERPMDEAARDELRTRAERLNPDGWVTADEVAAALEQYETVFEGLRGVVGRHPRGRRRGRR
jgi:hypothetical protein